MTTQWQRWRLLAAQGDPIAIAHLERQRQVGLACAEVPRVAGGLFAEATLKHLRRPGNWGEVPVRVWWKV